MGELGAPTHLGAYLCYSAEPCDVAIAASAVRRVLTHDEAGDLGTIDLIEPLGVRLIAAHAEDARRVLLLRGIPQDRGLVVPRGGWLVDAVGSEVMAMPDVFRGHPFSGVLAYAGGLALVLNLEAIGRLLHRLNPRSSGGESVANNHVGKPIE